LLRARNALCVANLHTNTGKSDPDSNCDIHGNTHCNCYGDAGFHAYSYSYSYSYGYHSHA
jgi:hypothetical protein